MAGLGRLLARPALGAVAWVALAPSPLPAAEPPSASAQPLVIELNSDRGPTPVYRVGEGLTVFVRTNLPANVYCFYQQGDGKVMRIFPNRFRPSASIKADTPLGIPDSSMQFRFRFDHPLVSESIRCFATTADTTVDLGSTLSPDQAPLPLSDLSAVSATVRQAVGNGAQLAVATMSIAVSDTTAGTRR